MGHYIFIGTFLVLVVLIIILRDKWFYKNDQDK